MMVGVADLTTNDVIEIREFLARTNGDLTRWFSGFEWAPGWGSEAAQEVANSEVRADGSAWGDAPVRTAYAAAGTFIFAAQDLLSTIMDSVSVMTTAYVPSVLARGMMEAGAQAWWLLEPGIGARRRIIRSVLIRVSSARKLGQAVKKADPGAAVTKYGEDRATVRAYATALGLAPYVCNHDRTECEGESLPGYTSRATTFESEMKMSAAYKIYSGAAHAELYSVGQGWREVPATAASGLRWERRPDREIVWGTVLAAAGFATFPAWQALRLLGRNASLTQLLYSMRAIDEMTRRLGLPPEWRY
jgi:hypothetical protein